MNGNLDQIHHFYDYSKKKKKKNVPLANGAETRKVDRVQTLVVYYPPALQLSYGCSVFQKIIVGCGSR